MGNRWGRRHSGKYSLSTKRLSRRKKCVERRKRKHLEMEAAAERRAMLAETCGEELYEMLVSEFQPGPITEETDLQVIEIIEEEEPIEDQVQLELGPNPGLNEPDWEVVEEQVELTPGINNSHWEVVADELEPSPGLDEPPDWDSVEPDLGSNEPNWYSVEPDLGSNEPNWYSVEPDLGSNEPKWYSVEPDLGSNDPTRGTHEHQLESGPKLGSNEPHRNTVEHQLGRLPRLRLYEPILKTVEHQLRLGPKLDLRKPTRETVEHQLRLGPTLELTQLDEDPFEHLVRLGPGSNGPNAGDDVYGNNLTLDNPKGSILYNPKAEVPRKSVEEQKTPVRLGPQAWGHDYTPLIGQPSKVDPHRPDVRRQLNFDSQPCEQSGTKSGPLEVDIQIEGRRIVDLTHFWKELQLLTKHGAETNCKFQDMRLVNYADYGMRTVVFFRCTNCGFGNSIWTDPKETPLMGLHDSATLGCILTGTGYTGLLDKMAAMSIPCISQGTFQASEERLIEVLKRVADREMKLVGDEERRIAIEKGHVVNGMPYITVTADGSWMKRSYRNGKYDSLSGLGVIVGCETRKVLFLGVRNKYCAACNTAELRKMPVTPHKCYKNFDRDQSSTSMETDCILEGFKESVATHALIYKFLVADGDSNTYKAICDHDVYGEYKVRVEKIECSNHLMRALHTRLLEIARTTRLVRRSKKDTTVRALRLYAKRCAAKIRFGITACVKRRIPEDLELPQKRQELLRDILNVPNHVFGDHTECLSRGMPCQGQSKPREQNYLALMKSSGLYEPTYQTVRQLSCHVNSLLMNVNNNPVENFNGIVSKFTGGKRINFGMRGSYNGRCYAAVIRYNTFQVMSKVSEEMSKVMTSTSQLVEHRKNSQLKKNRATPRKDTPYKPKKRAGGVDKNYGPAAQRPDMDEEVFQMQKEQHYVNLQRDAQSRQEIERATVGREREDVWHYLQLHLLMAPRFGKICRSRETTSCAPIVRSILYPSRAKNDTVSPDEVFKAKALKQLEEKLGQTITPCGLFIDGKDPYLAATATGLLGEDSIVELKCLDSTLAPDEAVKECWLKGVFKNSQDKDTPPEMSKTHHLYYQIQGQLHITERKTCYFCVWTQGGFKCVQVERNDTFWAENMAPNLKRFYDESILPEILDSRLARNMPLRETQLSASTQEKVKTKSPARKRTKVSQDEGESSQRGNEDEDEEDEEDDDDVGRILRDAIGDSDLEDLLGADQENVGPQENANEDSGFENTPKKKRTPRSRKADKPPGDGPQETPRKRPRSETPGSQRKKRSKKSEKGTEPDGNQETKEPSETRPGESISQDSGCADLQQDGVMADPDLSTPKKGRKSGTPKSQRKRRSKKTEKSPGDGPDGRNEDIDGKDALEGSAENGETKGPETSSGPQDRCCVGALTPKRKGILKTPKGERKKRSRKSGEPAKDHQEVVLPKKILFDDIESKGTEGPVPDQRSQDSGCADLQNSDGPTPAEPGQGVDVDNDLIDIFDGSILYVEDPPVLEDQGHVVSERSSGTSNTPEPLENDFPCTQQGQGQTPEPGEADQNLGIDVDLLDDTLENQETGCLGTPEPPGDDNWCTQIPRGCQSPETTTIDRQEEPSGTTEEAPVPGEDERYEVLGNYLVDVLDENIANSEKGVQVVLANASPHQVGSSTVAPGNPGAPGDTNSFVQIPREIRELGIPTNQVEEESENIRETPVPGEDVQYVTFNGDLTNLQGAEMVMVDTRNNLGQIVQAPEPSGQGHQNVVVIDDLAFKVNGNAEDKGTKSVLVGPEPRKKDISVPWVPREDPRDVFSDNVEASANGGPLLVLVATNDGCTNLQETVVETSVKETKSKPRTTLWKRKGVAPAPRDQQKPMVRCDLQSQGLPVPGTFPPLENGSRTLGTPTSQRNTSAGRNSQSVRECETGVSQYLSSRSFSPNSRITNPGTKNELVHETSRNGMSPGTPRKVPRSQRSPLNHGSIRHGVTTGSEMEMVDNEKRSLTPAMTLMTSRRPEVSRVSWAEWEALCQYKEETRNRSTGISEGEIAVSLNDLSRSPSIHGSVGNGGTRGAKMEMADGKGRSCAPSMTSMTLRRPEVPRVSWAEWEAVCEYKEGVRENGGIGRQECFRIPREEDKDEDEAIAAAFVTSSKAATTSWKAIATATAPARSPAAATASSSSFATATAIAPRTGRRSFATATASRSFATPIPIAPKPIAIATAPKPFATATASRSFSTPIPIAPKPMAIATAPKAFAIATASRAFSTPIPIAPKPIAIATASRTLATAIAENPTRGGASAYLGRFYQ